MIKHAEQTHEKCLKPFVWSNIFIKLNKNAELYALKLNEKSINRLTRIWTPENKRSFPKWKRQKMKRTLLTGKKRYSNIFWFVHELNKNVLNFILKTILIVILVKIFTGLNYILCSFCVFSANLPLHVLSLRNCHV